MSKQIETDTKTLISRVLEDSLKEAHYYRTELGASNCLDGNPWLIARRMEDGSVRFYGDWLDLDKPTTTVGWGSLEVVPYHLGGAYMFGENRSTELVDQLSQNSSGIFRMHRRDFYRQRLTALEGLLDYLNRAVAA